MTTSVSFDRTSLDRLMAAVKKQPEAGQTMWRASTRWMGGFQSQAQIRDFTITMDEPAVLGGADTGPNMVEMVLGAYGCCLTTGYAMNAALRDIQLDDIQIELEGDLDLNGFFGLKKPDACWPGFSDIRANVSIKAPSATREQIEDLHRAVIETSPVGSILERPVRVSANLID